MTNKGTSDLQSLTPEFKCNVIKFNGSGIHLVSLPGYNRISTGLIIYFSLNGLAVGSFWWKYDRKKLALNFVSGILEKYRNTLMKDEEIKNTVIWI